jgi:hypothetical protein
LLFVIILVNDFYLFFILLSAQYGFGQFYFAEQTMAAFQSLYDNRRGIQDGYRTTITTTASQLARFSLRALSYIGCDSSGSSATGRSWRRPLRTRPTCSATNSSTNLYAGLPPPTHLSSLCGSAQPLATDRQCQFAGNVYANPSLIVPGVADRANLYPMYQRLHRAIRQWDDQHGAHPSFRCAQDGHVATMRLTTERGACIQ